MKNVKVLKNKKILKKVKVFSKSKYKKTYSTNDETLSTVERIWRFVLINY